MSSCQINLNDVYRYLGYHNQLPEEETVEQVKSLSEKLLEKAEMKSVYQIFPIGLAEEVSVLGTTLKLTGEDIKLLLKESHHCVLLAVTLGQGVDRLIRELQIRDMAQAVILDACASSLVEEYCNEVEAEIAQTLENTFFTDRFSAGYGDLPLEIQPEFCKILNTAKKIGITVSNTNIMSPKKSITAILGISDSKQPMRIKGCKHCPLRTECSYRKGGKTCGTSTI